MAFRCYGASPFVARSSAPLCVFDLRAPPHAVRAHALAIGFEYDGVERVARGGGQIHEIPPACLPLILVELDREVISVGAAHAGFRAPAADPVSGGQAGAINIRTDRDAVLDHHIEAGWRARRAPIRAADAGKRIAPGGGGGRPHAPRRAPISQNPPGRLGGAPAARARD